MNDEYYITLLWESKQSNNIGLLWWSNGIITIIVIIIITGLSEANVFIWAVVPYVSYDEMAIHHIMVVVCRRS